jgi:hypothetical protein
MIRLKLLYNTFFFAKNKRVEKIQYIIEIKAGRDESHHQQSITHMHEKYNKRETFRYTPY